LQLLAGKREEVKTETFIPSVSSHKKTRRRKRGTTLPAPKSHNSFFPVTEELRVKNHYQKFWSSKYGVIFICIGRFEASEFTFSTFHPQN